MLRLAHSMLVGLLAQHFSEEERHHVVLSTIAIASRKRLLTRMCIHTQRNAIYNI